MSKSVLALVFLAGCATGVDPGTGTTTASLSSGGMTIPPATGWPGDTSTSGTTRSDGSVDWCCSTWVVPLPVQAGDVVGSVTIPVRDNGADNGHSTGGNTVTAFVGTAGSNGAFNAAVFATTNGSGSSQTLTLTYSPPHTVASGETLQLRLKAQTPGLFGGTPATYNSWVGIVVVAAPAYCHLINLASAAWHIRDTRSSGTLGLTADGLWSFDPTAPGEVVAALPLPAAVQLTSLRFHIKRNNPIHPSTGIITAILYGRMIGSPGITTTALSATADQTFGVDWTTLDLLPSGVFSVDSQEYWLSVAASGFLGFQDPGPLFDGVSLCWL